MPNKIEKDYTNRQQSNLNLLNSKFQERLGYLGIYSQRNYQHFFNNLSPIEQQKLIEEFKAEYYEILTNYFSEETKINSEIDRFVEKAFFVNLPLDKVVEIHIELIEDLGRELKFKGLHSDFLSDYRLTLIDVITHLGEMYRSVISKNCAVYR